MGRNGPLNAAVILLPPVFQVFNLPQTGLPIIVSDQGPVLVAFKHEIYLALGKGSLAVPAGTAAPATRVRV